MSNTALARELRAGGRRGGALIPLARRYTAALALMLIVLALLEWGLPAAGVPPYLLPTPSRVAARLIEPRGDLLGHAAATATAAVAGLAAGAVAALALAVAFVQLRPLEDALYPWVLVSQAVPAAALAPLLTIWLDDGLTPRAAMAALFAFFPVLVGAARGLRDVPPEGLALLRAWGVGPWATLRHLRLPSALPAIFGGLRVAAALAVVGAIVSELAGSGRGLGFVVSVGTYHLATDRVFAAVALAAAISLALTGALALAERAVVFWRRD
ncbi:MAG TPA: ABC transporter permease subunit [Chloroflexaceae bacterium]|nr:ABC transporter permease subunit [Chloroflexaceae bacterium]